MGVSPDHDVPRMPHAARPLTFDVASALERLEARVWTDLLALAEPAEAARVGRFTQTIQGATALGAAGLDVLFFNRVIGLGIDMPASARALDMIVHRYASAGVARFFVHLSPLAQPSRLAELLRTRRFVHHNNWAKLCHDTRTLPEVRTSLRIETIGPERAQLFAAITAPAFDWGAFGEHVLARSVGTAGWVHYIAYDGEQPVAAAAFRALGTHAYFGPAATLPAYRGRGAQSALIARRIRDAAAAGCQWLVTETSEDRAGHPARSFRNLTRAGFQLVSLRANYRWSRPA